MGLDDIIDTVDDSVINYVIYRLNVAIAKSEAPIHRNATTV